MENIRFCSHCGAQISDNDRFCPRCGAKIEESSSQSEPATFQAASTGTKHQAYSTGPAASTGGNPTLGLVFGILSIVLGGYLWSILGVVFSKPQKDTDSKAKIGFILSIVGFFVSTIYLVILIVQIVSILQRAGV